MPIEPTAWEVHFSWWAKVRWEEDTPPVAFGNHAPARAAALYAVVMAWTGNDVGEGYAYFNQESRTWEITDTPDDQVQYFKFTYEVEHVDDSVEEIP